MVIGKRGVVAVDYVIKIVLVAIALVVFGFAIYFFYQYLIGGEGPLQYFKTLWGRG